MNRRELLKSLLIGTGTIGLVTSAKPRLDVAQKGTVGTGVHVFHDGGWHEVLIDAKYGLGPRVESLDKYTPFMQVGKSHRLVGNL